MATLYLYDYLSVDVSSATKQKWNLLYQELRELGWRTPVGNRQGFVNVTRSNRRIYGYFANEGRLKVVLFDNKKKLVTFPSAYYAFEYIFFILFEDTAQIVIQSKRVSDYVDLTYRKIKSNFLLQLFYVFRECGFSVVGKTLALRNIMRIIDQTKLKGLFLNLRVTKLEVDSITQAAIPAKGNSKFVLKNSQLGNDECIWLLLSDLIKNGLDRINLIAGNSNSANLRSPFSQALLTTGQINLIEGYAGGNFTSQKRYDKVKAQVRLPYSLVISKSLIATLEQKFP